jgi:hypothetical protein
MDGNKFLIYNTKSEVSLYISLFTMYSFVYAGTEIGEWSTWSPWAECTVICGGGVRIRSRSCTDPPPQNGGDYCEGMAVDSEQCAPWQCPEGKEDFLLF